MINNEARKKMLTIWKYPFKITDTQSIMLPEGAKPLTVQIQNDEPCLWVLVDSTHTKKEKTIFTYGTGHSIDPPPGEYLGTYQFVGGTLVFHVFMDGGETI